MPSIDLGTPLEVDDSRSTTFGTRNGSRLSSHSPRFSVTGPILRRQGGMIEYAIDRDGLLFHPGLRLLCQLNETAFFVWRHCDGRRVEELAVLLTEEFEVGIGTARQHVAGVIELFSISGFIVEEAFHAVS